MQRHRHQKFIRFLNAIEAGVPVGRVVHVSLDNYATPRHPNVLAWLSRYPRFVFHFTPTACSWLNAVETFFAALTKRRLRRGVFRSIVDLQTAIKRYPPSTIPSRSPSSGPPIPSASSPPSDAGNKRSRDGDRR